jgi:hypothetical protein
VRSERRKVCVIAVRKASSCQSESKGSSYHHRIENPCHVLLDRPELNEKTTAITTGTTDHSR